MQVPGYTRLDITRIMIHDVLFNILHRTLTFQQAGQAGALGSSRGKWQKTSSELVSCNRRTPGPFPVGTHRLRFKRTYLCLVQFWEYSELLHSHMKAKHGQRKDQCEQVWPGVVTFWSWSDCETRRRGPPAPAQWLPAPGRVNLLQLALAAR